MIHDRRVLVLDVDGTRCHLVSGGERYADPRPVPQVVTRLREYKVDAWHVGPHASRRGMRSLEGTPGLITARVVPDLTRWLERHVGKSWAGHDGFYVDDRAVRPDEFVSHSADELRRLTGSS